MTELKLYQVGTFAAGNRLLDPSGRTEQSMADRTNSITSGHRACRGCGPKPGSAISRSSKARSAIRTIRPR